VTFDEMADLEPGLGTLADEIIAGKRTLGEIILDRTLLPGLVGKHVAHPRLRAAGCYGVAYAHLAGLDKARRERLQVQG